MSRVIAAGFFTGRCPSCPGPHADHFKGVLTVTRSGNQGNEEKGEG